MQGGQMKDQTSGLDNYYLLAIRTVCRTQKQAHSEHIKTGRGNKMSLIYRDIVKHYN